MSGSAYDWDGPTKGEFDDALNWSNANNGSHAVPGGLDGAIVLGTATRRITITGPGAAAEVATLDARYLTIAVTISAGSADLGGNDVLDTGAGLNAGDIDIGGDFTIGGFVDVSGDVSMDSPGGSVTIGVSTGKAQSIGWTSKGYFDDFDGNVTVEHGGSYLSVSANNAADGMDLRSGADKLVVSDDATLTTSGLFASYGATVVFETFAHVYATGSNFSYDKTLFFEGPYVVDGLVSADFEGPTTISNADFTGKGAILIGYQNEEDAASLTDKASVHVLGSAHVTNSFTLIADGALVLEGSATWTAGAGSAKNGMEGAIQVGWFSNVAKTKASLSVENSAILKGAALTIEPNGAFSLGADGRVVLGSGAARAGAVAVGAAGTLKLDGASGGYKAATDIEGGAMDVERAGASGTSAITFESQGGALVVSKGASIGNKIAGFSDKASIDFLGLATTSATFKNDVLTLMDKSKVVATVKFATPENLIVGSDHKGGTEITYGGKAGVTFDALAPAPSPLGRLYFIGLDSEGDPSLYASNASGADIKEVAGSRDIFVSAVDEPSVDGPLMVGVSDDLFMQGYSASHETQDLDVYNVSTGHLTNIHVADAWGSGLDPQDLVSYGEKAYFNGVDSNGSEKLWVSAGTTQSTRELSGSPADPSSLATFGADLFFDGVEAATGAHDLFAYNSTHGFSGPIGASKLDPRNLYAATLTEYGKLRETGLFMGGVDASHKRGLYEYNGSTVRELLAGAAPGGVQPSDFVNMATDVAEKSGAFAQSALYFSGADDARDHRGVWMTSWGGGTKEIVASTVGSSSLGLDPRDLTVFNGELYFTGNDNHGGRGLFVYDPITHKTSEAISSASYDLTDQYVAAWGDANQRSLAVEDGALFFGATKTGASGLESVPELWKATGTGASLHIAEVLGSGNVSQSGLIPQELYKY